MKRTSARTWCTRLASVTACGVLLLSVAVGVGASGTTSDEIMACAVEGGHLAVTTTSQCRNKATLLAWPTEGAFQAVVSQQNADEAAIAALSAAAGASAYVDHDSGIQIQVSPPSAPSAPQTVVNSLDLPAGNYVLSETVELNSQDNTGTVAGVGCEWSTPSSALAGTITLDDGQTATLSAQNGITLNSSTTVSVICGTQTANIFDQGSVLTAVQVATLHTSTFSGS